MLLGAGIFVGLLALALMNREAVRFFFFLFGCASTVAMV